MPRQTGLPPCSQTFKFVVVGDPSSGKTTLIKRFLSDFRGDKTEDEDDTEKQMYVCDGHTVVLNATVKHVRRDGSSVALKDSDIARQVWHKKFSKTKSLPKKFKMKLGQQDDISWDEIFVYLHKRPLLDNSTNTRDSADEINVETHRAPRAHKVPPEKPSRSYVHRHRKSGRIQSSPTRKSVDKCKSDATDIIVDIWDTGGDRSLMWYRWYACTGADAVLLCVPMSLILRFGDTRNHYSGREGDESDAISNSLRKFLTDQFLSDKTKRLDYRVPPVILVGTQSDRCESIANHRRSVFEVGETNEADNIGLNLAADIGCCDFIYCSGLRGNGVASVFEAALAVSLTTDGQYRAYNATQKNIEPELSDCESSLSGEVACPTYFKVHTFPRNDAKALFEPNDVFNISSSEPSGRSPPQLYFPPPPDSPPSSTVPNSSDSSFESTESPQSSDSANAIDVTAKSNMPVNQLFISQAAAVEATTTASKPRIVSGKPTPVPRRRIASDVCKKTPSAPSSNLSKAVDVTMSSQSLDLAQGKIPLPKPRNKERADKMREHKTDRTRRESIFVKFLQAK